MARVAVLGCGLVGGTIAIDLNREVDLDVSVVDVDTGRVEQTRARCRSQSGRDVHGEAADLSNTKTVSEIAQSNDIVVGALPSRFGFQTLQAVIASGTPYVDISFMPEDALALDATAADASVTAIVDCGVAPGLSNMLAAAAASQIGPACEEVSIYVGGLPREPHWPFFYKAPFSPWDVIEEYTRPARLVEDGEEVVHDALSGIEDILFSPDRFPGVGTLEACNTDGLRSLIATLDVPTMREKTLRYPGHIELMKAFREAGLFGLEAVDINGASVRPRDLLASVLFPKWQFNEGEGDLTIMRVTARSPLSSVSWELFDEADTTTGCSSMSRTTAFPATHMVRELLAGRVAQAGVLPLERIFEADPTSLERMLDSLRARGIRLWHDQA